jgi:hypothetical protein
MRASIIKVPDASPGLLIVDGRQLPFTLEQVWRSPVAPAPNMVVDVELDALRNLVAITVVDQQQLAKERLHQLGGVAQVQARQAADVAQKGVGALAERMGRTAFVATVVLWIAWFFLPAIEISFFATRSFTFWQLLTLDMSNPMQASAGGMGAFSLLGLAAIAAPLAAPFVAHRRAKLLNALPFGFLLLVVVRMLWNLRQATRGFGAESESVASGIFDVAQQAISLGIGLYALVLASLVLAAIALRSERTAGVGVTVAVLLCSVIGCAGSGIEGTYSGKGTGFLQQIVFKSDGKVELTFMGMTREGTYEVEGNKVKVTNAGTTEILTIGGDGCLDGGGIMGRYCKEGATPAAAATSGRGGSAMSGTWEARHPQGSIALAFLDGGTVRVTITESGTVNDSAEGTYSLRGDRVTVGVPGGPPLELTRKGDTLEGWMEGVGMRFEKQ